ncbi:carbohydrate-binding domain-containing protein [Actinomyces dentalis]|uniref:carbohydrate-binding domain-containing protein n=1 Tax=Actinomyces dentalis TaxID=272548 RepID=UPI0028EB8AE0|nr:carbohydrate-binding domain-containing protein [Actinomyces dentalis]
MTTPPAHPTDPSGARRRRFRLRAAGALAALAAGALVAGCSTTGATSASADSSSQASSATTWTTISSSVRQASTGATTAQILAANADTSGAAGAASQTEASGGWDESGATAIALSGDSATASGRSAAAVSVDGSTITITAGGTYVVSGALTDGEIVVVADDADVHLVLNGASITNADGPAIDVRDAGSAVLVLARGSDNALADGAAYADTGEDAPTAALFSSDTLTLTGTGSLTVTGAHEDGISSKNGLAVTGSPTITVNAADDGLRGKDWLLIDGGTLTVTAGGDGLKSSEDDDETKGFVALGGAAVSVTAGDDGVAATTDVTVEGTDLTIAAGGGQANATVQTQPGPGQAGADQGQAPPDQAGSGQGGASGQSPADSASSSDDTAAKPKGIDAGVSYTQDSGTVRIDAADEGVQAAFVNVGGGVLTVDSGDDAINASNGDHTIEGYESADSESDDGSVLTISGGQVQLDYVGSDGIDSNGSAFVTGGQVLIGGQAGAMDGAVDANGESTLVGVTGSPGMAEGDTVTVTSADGTSWQLTSTVSADYTTVLGLTEGTQYTVSTTSGGSATNTASALSSGVDGAGGGPGPGGPGGAGQAPDGQGGPGQAPDGTRATGAASGQ